LIKKEARATGGIAVVAMLDFFLASEIRVCASGLGAYAKLKFFAPFFH